MPKGSTATKSKRDGAAREIMSKTGRTQGGYKRATLLRRLGKRNQPGDNNEVGRQNVQAVYEKFNG